MIEVVFRKGEAIEFIDYDTGLWLMPSDVVRELAAGSVKVERGEPEVLSTGEVVREHYYLVGQTVLIRHRAPRKDAIPPPSAPPPDYEGMTAHTGRTVAEEMRRSAARRARWSFLPRWVYAVLFPNEYDMSERQER